MINFVSVLFLNLSCFLFLTLNKFYLLNFDNQKLHLYQFLTTFYNLSPVINLLNMEKPILHVSFSTFHQEHFLYDYF